MERDGRDQSCDVLKSTVAMAVAMAMAMAGVVGVIPSQPDGWRSLPATTRPVSTGLIILTGTPLSASAARSNQATVRPAPTAVYPKVSVKRDRRRTPTRTRSP